MTTELPCGFRRPLHRHLLAPVCSDCPRSFLVMSEIPDDQPSPTGDLHTTGWRISVVIESPMTERWLEQVGGARKRRGCAPCDTPVAEARKLEWGSLRSGVWERLASKPGATAHPEWSIWIWKSPP